ncbi:hypothetical protein KIN20_003067, partial [Parelaphostrongylus tenuis]
CARRRRLVLDQSAQNELLGLIIPQCEPDGMYYRKRQCRVGTESCWCVTPLGRRVNGIGTECESRRMKQENMAMKAVKLRDELIRGKICEEYRDGDCPTSSGEKPHRVAVSLRFGLPTALEVLCTSK